MKTNSCYIYVKRNWGNGYGEASPSRSWIREWFHSRSKTAADEEFECLQQRLRTQPGVPLYYKEGYISDFVWPLFFKWHLNCYAAKFVAPDRECPDLLARGRDPRVTVYLIFEGCPQTLPAARFDLFVKSCLDVALAIKSPGIKEELRLTIPSEFFNVEE